MKVQIWCNFTTNKLIIHVQKLCNFVFNVLACFPIVDVKFQLWLRFWPEFFQIIALRYFAENISDTWKLLGQRTNGEFFDFFSIQRLIGWIKCFQTLINNFLLNFFKMFWIDFLWNCKTIFFIRNQKLCGFLAISTYFSQFIHEIIENVCTSCQNICFASNFGMEIRMLLQWIRSPNCCK